MQFCNFIVVRYILREISVIFWLVIVAGTWCHCVSDSYTVSVCQDILCSWLQISAVTCNKPVNRDLL